jgi:hypothetical protein
VYDAASRSSKDEKNGKDTYKGFESKERGGKWFSN